MNWKPIARPRARLQIADATNWYDSQTPGRGDDFLRSFEDTIESICRNPFQYQVLRGDLRRAVPAQIPVSDYLRRIWRGGYRAQVRARAS
jgi:toxin ParE1/3/4